MSDKISCGCDYHTINNRQYKTIDTSNARRIIDGLELSGIQYFAKFDNKSISLIYSAKDTNRIDEIVERSSKISSAEVIEKVKRPNTEANNYSALFPEIALLLNVSVKSIESRPVDIQMMLAQIYINNCNADSIAIKEALGQVIELNAITQKEIMQAQQDKSNANNTPERRNDVHTDENTLANSAAIEAANYYEQHQRVVQEEQRTAFITRKQLFHIAENLKSSNKSRITENATKDMSVQKSEPEHSETKDEIIRKK